MSDTRAEQSKSYKQGLAETSRNGPTCSWNITSLEDVSMSDEVRHRKCIERRANNLVWAVAGPVRQQPRKPAWLESVKPQQNVYAVKAENLETVGTPNFSGTLTRKNRCFCEELAKPGVHLATHRKWRSELVRNESSASSCDEVLLMVQVRRYDYKGHKYGRRVWTSLQHPQASPRSSRLQLASHAHGAAIGATSQLVTA